MAEEEEMIFGLWTREEFTDDLVFVAFGALVGFITAFGYKFLSRWLEQHKWFKQE